MADLDITDHQGNLCTDCNFGATTDDQEFGEFCFTPVLQYQDRIPFPSQTDKATDETIEVLLDSGLKKDKVHSAVTIEIGPFQVNSVLANGSCDTNQVEVGNISIVERFSSGLNGYATSVSADIESQTINNVEMDVPKHAIHCSDCKNTCRNELNCLNEKHGLASTTNFSASCQHACNLSASAKSSGNACCVDSDSCSDWAVFDNDMSMSASSDLTMYASSQESKKQETLLAVDSSSPSTSAYCSSGTQQRLSNKSVLDIFNECFVLKAHNISEALELTSLSPTPLLRENQLLSESIVEDNVWTKINIVDDSASLRHQFNGSHTQALVLKAVAVDTTNILSKLKASGPPLGTKR